MYAWAELACRCNWASALGPALCKLQRDMQRIAHIRLRYLRKHRQAGLFAHRAPASVVVVHQQTSHCTSGGHQLTGAS